jgi:hypothetical protein
MRKATWRKTIEVNNALKKLANIRGRRERGELTEADEYNATEELCQAVATSVSAEWQIEYDRLYADYCHSNDSPAPGEMDYHSRGY